MTQPSTNINSDKAINVRRGRVASVDLFEVKENELEILEKGSDGNLLLNFSIAFFSIACSALFTFFATSKFVKPIYETLILIFIVVGLVAGIILFIFWRIGRKTVEEVIVTIKNRIPPEDFIQTEDSDLPVDETSTATITSPQG